MQDGLAVLIAKIHIFKANIAPERGACAVFAQPVPALAVLGLNQTHRSVVNLRLLAHDPEHALRAGQRRQQEVGLLGKLVDGHGRLTHKHQIAGQATHIGQPAQGQQTTEHSHDCIIDVGNGDDGRNHCGGIALGALAGFAQGLVADVELLEGRILVVKDLDHFLPGDHFFYIAVQLAPAFLLDAIKRLAAFAAVTDVEEHRRITHHHNQR